MTTVLRLGEEHVQKVTRVLCDAFYDYPVMGYVLIGVSRASQGSGLGRKLMDHVHLMSHEDASSQGVTLTTEDPANVPLYEHLGYRLVEHVTLSPTMGTWGFFRPD